MQKPGTLYQFFLIDGQPCVMLIETEKLPPEQSHFTYAHSLLFAGGEIEGIYTETEKIENDRFWGKHLKKVTE